MSGKVRHDDGGGGVFLVDTVGAPSRRAVLIGGLATAVAPTLVRAADERHLFDGSDMELAYHIMWRGKPIGSQEIQVRQDGSEARISHRIHAEVSFLFVNVLSLKHKSDEVWRDNELIELTSETVLNKVKTQLNGRRVGDEFIIESAEGEHAAPPGIATLDSFWLISAVKHDWLIDPRQGVVMSREKESLGRKEIELDGQKYDVEGYHVTSDGLRVELWYDGDFLLVSDVTSDGTTAHIVRDPAT